MYNDTETVRIVDVYNVTFSCFILAKPYFKCDILSTIKVVKLFLSANTMQIVPHETYC